MELFAINFMNLCSEMRWFALMFLLSGVALEFLFELVKGLLFPTKTEEQIAAGEKQKDCPRWLGLTFGIAATLIFLASAYCANIFLGPDGWTIPGGLIFSWVWFILFFMWQYVSMRLAKKMRNKLFPTLKNPGYRKEEKKKQETHRYTNEEIEQMIADAVAKKEG